MNLGKLLPTGMLAGALLLGNVFKEGNFNNEKSGNQILVDYSVQDLTLDSVVRDIVQENDANEVKAQKILDFVSRNVNYNPNEGNYNKTAVEVLSTRNADCRGKSVLFSSLLNRAGIDNVLVYYPNHLSVAVAGNHSNLNGQSFYLNDAKYSIADPSSEHGFRIGETKSTQLDLDKAKYLRKSIADTNFFDFKTGRQLEFVH